jgi:hypothetical protein
LNLYQYAPNAANWIDPLGWDWNYILVDANGNAYYHGRASDGQTMSDVMRRHGNNVGKDGKPRFGTGDTMHQVTPKGTDIKIVRGIESAGIREKGPVGKGSSTVRANIIHGISDEKLRTKEGKRRADAAKAHLKAQGVTKVSNLKPLQSKTKC